MLALRSMAAKLPQSTHQSLYLQHHHIKCLCGNVPDMTGDNLQWQLQGRGQSAGTISNDYICVCVHPFMAQISKRKLALALSWYTPYISSLLDSLF